MKRYRGIRIRIKCVFCGTWINNPTMGRMLCGKKECLKEYRKELARAYRRDPKNKKKLKEYRKEYNQRPEVKKKRNIKQKIYARALRELRNNHKEEFKDIHEKLKGKRK